MPIPCRGSAPGPADGPAEIVGPECVAFERERPEHFQRASKIAPEINPETVACTASVAPESWTYKARASSGGTLF
jgi:hypothetical protein